MSSFKLYSLWLLLLTMSLAGGTVSADVTSYIDEHNRFILNGEPFFPLGLYVVECTNGNYASELDEIADSPFDTLMNYAVNKCGSDASDAQILGYLDQLASRNLKLIFSLSEYFDGGQADIDTITQKVSTFKTHPAVISWYLNDERDPSVYLTQLEERYQRIREVDDNHPVWSVHWWPDHMLAEAHTTDIVGIDSYPIDNLPITVVGDFADTAMQAGKPLWFVPQIFNWQDYPWDFRAATGRPPTREEMRAMTYLATNHGAKGLIYYSYFNIRDDADYATRWPQIKDIASEIDQLRPVFLSIDETNDNDITCNNLDIDLKLMREGATYYLFAVNTKEEAISGVSLQINLAQAPSVLDTLFEGGRQVTVTDGTLTDNFGLYEVHVYRWEGATPCSCVVVPDNTVVARGGTLGFQASVTDNTGAGGMVLFGTKVTKPDASQTGFIWGPLQVWLNPHQTKSGHKTHTVPSGFELGTYTYHGYVGRYGNIYDECQFDFEVVP